MDDYEEIIDSGIEDLVQVVADLRIRVETLERSLSELRFSFSSVLVGLEKLERWCSEMKRKGPMVEADQPTQLHAKWDAAAPFNEADFKEVDKLFEPEGR